MVLGSLVAALGAYLFQMITARAVGNQAYAPLSVLWTAQYLLLSVVLYGLEAWGIRAVRQASGALTQILRATRSLVIQLTMLAAVLTAVVLAGRGTLLAGQGGLAGVVFLTVVTYSLFVLVRAVLAGRQRFLAYGVVTGLEAVVRLALATIVLLLGWGATGVAWIMPLGALGAAAFWLVARRTRSFPGPVPIDEGAGMARPGRFLLATVPANACSQLLLAGGPLVLAVSGARPEVTSTFFVAVTAARMPLVVTQGGLLSRLLPTFTDLVRRGDRRALTRIVLRVLQWGVVVAFGCGLAAMVAGPAVLAVLYGQGFRPSRLLAACSLAGVMLAAASMLLNQVLIACHDEHVLIWPWLIALATAAAVFVLPQMTEQDRAALGFLAGQLVALVALSVTALQRITRLDAFLT
jgi:O-antigen/teichoic acid export membrane protein